MLFDFLLAHSRVLATNDRVNVIWWRVDLQLAVRTTPGMLLPSCTSIVPLISPLSAFGEIGSTAVPVGRKNRVGPICSRIEGPHP